MSEKQSDTPKSETPKAPPKTIEIPKEEYWSYIKVVKEAVKFIDGTLYPMLERRGVGKETIASLSVLFAAAVQEVMITQMSIMRVGIEPTTSLSQVEKVVNEIYKQYSSGTISPKEAIDAIFNVLGSLSKKSK